MKTASVLLAAAVLTAWLSAGCGNGQTCSPAEQDQRAVYVKIDRDKAAALNVSVADINRAIEDATARGLTVDELRALRLPTATGDEVSLSEVAELSVGPAKR